MKPSYLLGLAPCACAIEHLASFQLQNPGSSLWIPPPLQLVCALDEVDATRPSPSAGATGGKKHGNQTGRVPPKKTAPLPPPEPQWEGPKECLSSFCIYFNRGFANGRGIVAVTTAPNLERLKVVEQAISNSLHTTPPESPKPPYTIVQVPGKGLGMIASTPLTRTTPLMKNIPALLVHRSFLEGLPPSQAQHDLLEKAVTYLPPSLHEVFMSQMAHFGGHKIVDIIATNSFQMNLDPTGKDQNAHHYGNYPEVSRLNHDCRPNVAFYIDKNTLTHTTTVVRPVKPGEELTISYLDPLKPRDARIHRANLAWGFGCTCAQCSLPAPLSAKSDERLGEIAAIEGKLSDVYNKEVSVKMLDRLAKLYKSERLDTKLASPYTLLALNYNMLGEEKKARKYAKLAHEVVVVEHGDGTGDAVAMLELAGNPRGHFTWRARLKMR